MSQPRRIAVVTGTRAEYGLLRPIMHGIERHDDLDLRTIVAGAHLLPPSHTIEEVRGEFTIDAEVPMQEPDATARVDDARALGRGITSMADLWARVEPDVVLVLGDRIEAFAAASSAAVAGIRVAHVHGGDRAEGVADESMRHAVSKLAHIHFPATGRSTERLIAMGEVPLSVHLVGSPAIDELDDMGALSDDEYAVIGSPHIVVLLHPTGEDEEEEWSRATSLLRLCSAAAPTLALYPNHDPGRAGIVTAIEESGAPNETHLERARFIGVLRRCRALVGNSSAGLIECAALGVPAINIGPRQAGREKPRNVIDVPDWDLGEIDIAIEQACHAARAEPDDRYGDGQCGQKVAAILATLDESHHPLHKRNSY